MPEFDSIILHCTYRPGVPDHSYLDWDGVVRFHVKQQHYDYVGYHGGIERVKGHLVFCPGRPFRREGAHCRGGGMNWRALGLAVIGNYDIHPPDNDLYLFTAQVCRCFMLIFPKITVERIFPHSAFSAKTCPGKMFDVGHVRHLIQRKNGLD